MMKIKEAKSTRKCVRTVIKTPQIENKIKHLEKNKIDVDSIKEGQKESQDNPQDNFETFIDNFELNLETLSRKNPFFSSSYW